LTVFLVKTMIGVMKAVEVISASGAALAALDPIRARLLAELRVPASATELAPRVGLSRQRVNYHLRKLEDQGLVVAAETRQWGGLTERRLVASAAGYVLSPGALGAAAAEPGSTPDRASVSYLLSLAGRLIREVGGMLAGAGTGSSAGPGAAPARVPVLALDVDVKFGSPADRAAFADELTTCVIALVARYHDQNASQGRWHRVLVGVHPVPADVSVGPPTDPVPAFEQPAEEKP
jgi:DNA-binding transcriptional ArsR family regulator